MRLVHTKTKKVYLGSLQLLFCKFLILSFESIGSIGSIQKNLYRMLYKTGMVCLTSFCKFLNTLKITLLRPYRPTRPTIDKRRLKRNSCIDHFMDLTNNAWTILRFRGSHECA